MGLEEMKALLAKWQAEDKKADRIVEPLSPSDWWQAIKRAGRSHAKRQGYENVEEFLRWLYDQFMAGRRGESDQEEKAIDLPVEKSHAAHTAPDD